MHDPVGSDLSNAAKRILEEVGKMAGMSEEEFRWWHRYMKKELNKYAGRGDEIARTAMIAGFFGGMSREKVFTAAQVSEILALRRPEKEMSAHNEAATSKAL